MQLLKSNPDGTDQTVTEVPGLPSIEAIIEHGRAASEGGFITLLGGDFNPQPPRETRPEDPPLPPYYPSVLAVFNNGAQIVCNIV